MRKIHDKDLYLRLSKSRALKAQRRRLKRRAKAKSFRRSLLGRSKYDVSMTRRRRSEIRVSLPVNFSLFTDTDSCISVINKLEAHFEKRRPVFVDMEKVVKIDYGALSALLAVMFKFKEQHIPFNGNFPNEPVVKKTIQESGFLYRLFDDSSSKTIYQINEKHQFVTQYSGKKFDPRLISEQVVPDATTTIWGSPKRCPGIFPIVLELIENTRVHASKRGEDIERWWLSINHDEANKKVNFVFLDYGIGIFSSLANKPGDDPRKKTFAKLQQDFGMAANDKHLETMVTQGSMTSTGLKHRGRGIHGIGQAVGRNQISDLFIVSNYAFGDISNAKYMKTSDDFNGTLFSWELCYSNEHLD